MIHRQLDNSPSCLIRQGRLNDSDFLIGSVDGQVAAKQVGCAGYRFKRQDSTTIRVASGKNGIQPLIGTDIDKAEGLAPISQ